MRDVIRLSKSLREEKVRYIKLYAIRKKIIYLCKLSRIVFEIYLKQDTAIKGSEYQCNCSFNHHLHRKIVPILVLFKIIFETAYFLLFRSKVS